MYQDRGELDRVRLQVAKISCDRAIDRQTHSVRMEVAVKQTYRHACLHTAASNVATHSTTDY